MSTRNKPGSLTHSGRDPGRLARANPPVEEETPVVCTPPAWDWGNMTRCHARDGATDAVPQSCADGLVAAQPEESKKNTPPAAGQPLPDMPSLHTGCSRKTFTAKGMGTRLASWRGVWGSVLVHLCAVATLVAAPLGGSTITSSSTGHMMVSLASLPGGAGQGTSGAPAEPSGRMSRESATPHPSQQTQQETVTRPETTPTQRRQAAKTSPKDIAPRHDKRPERKTDQPAPKPAAEKPTAATTPPSGTTATDVTSPPDTPAHDASAPASAAKATAGTPDNDGAPSGNDGTGDITGDNSGSGSGETAKTGQGKSSGHGEAGPATPFGYALADVDAPPTVSSKVPPDYPRRARRTGTEGRVVLRLLVHENGAPGHLSVVESTPPGIFDQSAMEAVARWRFAPGRREGRAVPTWVLLPVRFDLASR
ncbi:TonB family protein [Nitratidesulfovibrio vulgaris]|uniref:TonB family protein n=1 Tax=Nitratidesulfovibrio vulgaris TaxID=881 RepID=UPI001F14C567|nr:TonB family protein [Nitratidesulfovibrio vulgaris]